MDSTSDDALMLKVKDGDLDKLGLLFERYQRRLYGFFYRMNRQKEVSEDLVQEVFERILKYRHTYQSGNSFATWIFRIARNLQVDRYRENQKIDQVNHTDWERVEGNFTFPDLDSGKERERQWLQQALERLDHDKKETLILSRYEGFKYREIAEILDCSVSAVKVRIFRAINELKEITTELRNREN